MENRLYEQGSSFVIGCDEVGRGCLAGPVVAAAVVLPFEAGNSLLDADNTSSSMSHNFYTELNDSKKLSSNKRFTLEKQILQHAVVFGIGTVSPMVIDKINIHNASLLAMQRAVSAVLKKLQLNFAQKFSHETTTVLIDGKFTIPKLPENLQQQTVVGGDSQVLSIAASSILAKTYRDRLMTRLGELHPEYSFAQHKGYATLVHRQALAKHGPVKCVHRESFLH